MNILARFSRWLGLDKPPLTARVKVERTRKPVKFDHVICAECGRLRALRADGEFHNRPHNCAIPKPVVQWDINEHGRIVETAEALTRTEGQP